MGSAEWRLAPCGAKRDTTVTPMSTRSVATAPRADGTSRSVRQPVAARRDENTIVSLSGQEAGRHFVLGSAAKLASAWADAPAAGTGGAV